MALQSEAARVHQPMAITRLMHHRRVIVRAGMMAIFICTFVIFAVSIPATYRDLSAPPPDVRAGLDDLGLSTRAYALFLTGLAICFAGCCFAIAWLVLRKRRDDGMAWLAAVFLVLLGGASNPSLQSLVEQYPSFTTAAGGIALLTWVLLAIFAVVFPSGKSVPGWSPPLLGMWAIGLGVTWLASDNGKFEPESDATGSLIMLALIAVSGAQVYRYVRVSGPVERRQTKWVVLGIALALTIQIAYMVIAPSSLALNRPGTRYDLGGATVVTLGYSLIPISIGIAILRYRLWDIDVVLNRALVYAGLTASVVALYVLIVGGVGSLLQAQDSLWLSITAAGLVAVLFQPLRLRLQGAVNRLMYGERDDPYGVLSRLNRRLEATEAPELALSTIAETVRDALKVPYVAIALDEQGSSQLTVASGSPVRDPVQLPLNYLGEAVGELYIARRGGTEDFSPADRRLLDDLARQAGVAVHAVRLTAELQQSRERLVTAREEERRRLRRDLHDGLGPAIAAQTLKAGSARAVLASNPAAADALLASLESDQGALLTEVRRLVYDLRPPALDDLGLVSAIRQRAAELSRSGDPTVALQIDVVAPEHLPALPAAIEVAAYRIVDEALANVVRHAHATHCSVRIETCTGMLELDIRDNGVGFPVSRKAGVGLISMHERAAELGGSCDATTLETGGVLVVARLPLPEREND